jgi:proline dehydrogenase
MITRFLRHGILTAASQDWIEQFIRHGRFSRSLVQRFVAGDTREDALAVAADLAARGLTATLDRLGENVLTPDEAAAAAASYAETLRAMAARELQPNISVKLSMLGLDLSDDLAFDNMVSLLATADEVSGFVRIDMEGSAYTERTLRITEELHERFPGRVGTVIQSALHRSDRDVDRLVTRGIRVRLVKGAYAEPASVALQRPEEVDAAFVTLMERLLADGVYPAIATHDEAIVRATKGFALRMGIPREGWEFQMLYGVRRDEQVSIAREGYGMRIYVPFGVDWYPYFARRIAERPANALFVLRQIASR